MLFFAAGFFAFGALFLPLAGDFGFLAIVFFTGAFLAAAVFFGEA